MEKFGLVGIPLSVEVIVGVLALNLIPLVRGDYCGVVALSLIPLSVEVIVVGVCVCALSL